MPSTTHLIVSIAPGEAGDPVLSAARDAIAGAMPKLAWIGYLSTVGVYGDHGGGWVDEDERMPAGVAPLGDAGRRRDANGWRFGEETGLPVAVLRLSGIYGPGRNAFVNLENGTAKRLVKPGQVFNRIHAADIAGALWHLAERDQGGIFNVTDDLPAPPQDVVTYAARPDGRRAAAGNRLRDAPNCRRWRAPSMARTSASPTPAIKAPATASAIRTTAPRFAAMWADGTWRGDGDSDARSPMKRS